MSIGDTVLSGKLVVLFGGSGFLGAHVAQELLERGARLRIVTRRPDRAFHLKPLANLGQIQLVAGDLALTDYLPGLVAGAYGVVNLTGIPSTLAAAAAAAGVEALVHISALGADATGDEAAVLAAFPRATVLRPAILFGPDDRFLNRLAEQIASLPVVPAASGTRRAAPVFVDDVAEAVSNALADPAQFAGKTFELTGPEELSLGELQQRIAKATGRKPIFVGLPGLAFTRAQRALLNAAPTGLPGLKALGVTPRPLDLFLDRWLVRFRKHGRFGDKRGLA